MFRSKKEIFEFIDSQRSFYPLSLLCEVYDVSRFGYASWKRRGQSERSKKDVELLESIERVFHEVKGIFGSPKVYESLKGDGVLVGLNKVARMMREQGLKARCACIYRGHKKMDRFYTSLGNEIKDIEAIGPNQVWVGDVTYLRVNNEWRYLAVVLDKFSRRVVGWSLSSTRNVDLSLTAFKRAAKKRLVQPSLYFHSDRGTEYVATKYRNWLKKYGVVQSMNRKNVMNDNAEMESFFRSFKAERIHTNEFFTEKELRTVIIEHVGFYNQRRIHSSLEYMTPNAYEVNIV